MRTVIYMLYALAVSVLTSCQDNIAPDSGNGIAPFRLVSSLKGYSTGDAGSGGVRDEMSEVMCYHFIDGRLENIYAAESGEGMSFTFSPDRLAGIIYLVATESDDVSIGKVDIGMTEAMWHNTVISSDTATPGMFYTASVPLPGVYPSPVPVSLERGLARLDLRIMAVCEVYVKRIELRQAAVCSSLFPETGMSSGYEMRRKDIVICPDVPYSEDVTGLVHIFEQSGDAVGVIVEAVVDGKEYVLETVLPEVIVRNTVYTLTLRKDDTTGELSIGIRRWDDGGDTALVPDLDSGLTVDISGSEIPDDVLVDRDRTALVFPHTEVECVIAVECPDELELVSAEGYRLDVRQTASNTFRISKGLYEPGADAVDTELAFRRKGLSHIYPEDRIRLELSSNPTALTGMLDFGNEDYTTDFGMYIDNEYGTFILPEGKTIEAEFPDGEDRWLDIRPVYECPGSYRVIGGWRPNDPTADGRRQSAMVVIKNADGSSREEYTVVRRNYGLPVTYLHGIWWCKYNAMGNSRNFEDQILSSDDPAARSGKTLFEYLAGCTAEEYAGLWGWAYQGDSGIGMRVVDLDGIPSMDGFNPDNTVHINRLPADALSPDGYELPSIEDFNRIFDATDYIWMMWDGSHTLKTPWEGHSRIDRKQRRRNGIEVGEIVIDDLIYVSMSSPDFPENEAVVWYGPGTQWNTGEGIRHYGHHNNMLFGVYSPAGEGWYMGGSMGGLYMTKNGAGPKDTRILRFRKSDVEYIY